jgi:hypothetical protein
LKIRDRDVVEVSRSPFPWDLAHIYVCLTGAGLGWK